MYRWWGPKVLFWLILVGASFFIPNPFFMFWGNYVALVGATIFILLGLVLLVDFAHSWSETCLDKWENSPNSNLWQWILIGSTATMYMFTITLTGILYAYFAGSGCTLNRFFISFNLVLSIIITIVCVHPTIQEYNPRSGLAQSGMVAAYCTYLIVSAVGNYTHESESCNPLRNNSGTVNKTRTTAVVLGGLFTFLAIAYSTTRAATQSRALIGKGKRGVQLPADRLDGHAELGVVNTQPGRMESPRYQALLAAIEAGCVHITFQILYFWIHHYSHSAIPASALEEQESDDEDEEIDEGRDDERSGTRYNVTFSCFPAIVTLTLSV
jgi:hypothetical protein